MPGLRQVVEGFATRMLQDRAFFDAGLEEFDMALKDVIPFESLEVDVDRFPVIMLTQPKKTNRFAFSGFGKQENFMLDVVGYVAHDDTLVSALACMQLGDLIEQYFEQRQNFIFTIDGTPFRLIWPEDTCPVASITAETEAIGGRDHPIFIRTVTCPLQYTTDSTMGYPGSTPGPV